VLVKLELLKPNTPLTLLNVAMQIVFFLSGTDSLSAVAEDTTKKKVAWQWYSLRQKKSKSRFTRSQQNIKFG
jgi:hypothetical protein